MARTRNKKDDSSESRVRSQAPEDNDQSDDGPEDGHNETTSTAVSDHCPQTPSKSMTSTARGEFSTPSKYIKKHSKTEVFFVEVKAVGSVNRQPKAMQEAFNSMKSYKLEPKWMKENEVLTKDWSHKFNKPSFVVDSFGGKAFDCLTEKGFKIFGPLTILYCFSRESSKRFPFLPEKPYPVYSQCLRKYVVSLSGFEGQRKNEMISRINRMCGTHSKDFTKKVTHLVSDCVRSKKFKVAKANGIPVLTSQWLDDCWTEHQHNLIDGGHKDILAKYQVKIFANLLITVSQATIEEREQVKKIVAENGGEYSPSLKLNDPNSMLLLRTPEGEKFKYATMKAVPCLDIKWLFDSLENGWALPEEDYVIASSQKSNHSHSQNTLKVLSQNQNQKQNASVTSSTSLGSNRSLSGLSMSDKHQGKNQSEFNAGIIKQINELSAIRREESFLEGCDIYIAGFDRTVTDVMKSALISCGAMVYNEFKGLITHVIYGPNISKDENDKIFDQRSSKLMSIDWVVECLKTGEYCNKREFELMRPEEDSQSTKKSQSQDIFAGPLTVTTPMIAKKAIQDSSTEIVVDVDDIHKSMGEQLNNESDVQWDETGVLTQNKMKETPGKESDQDNDQTTEIIETIDVDDEETDDINNNETEDQNVMEDVMNGEPNDTNDLTVRSNTESIDLDSEDDNTEVSEVQQRKVILFSGYEDNERMNLEIIVEELGGLVVHSDNVDDNVTHLVIKELSATEKTLSAIANGIWVVRDVYLYKSKEAGHFVNEEEYEWYNVIDKEEKTMRKRIMLASRNWRIHLKEMTEKHGRRVKAFDRMNVLFLFQTKYTVPYSQVVKSSNANVLTMGPELDDEDLEKLDIAFVDHKWDGEVSKLANKIGKKLIGMNKLYKVDYISVFLMAGPKPDKDVAKKQQIKEAFWETKAKERSTRKRVKEETQESDSQLSETSKKLRHRK